jgi:hypothetical protein
MRPTALPVIEHGPILQMLIGRGSKPGLSHRERHQSASSCGLYADLTG